MNFQKKTDKLARKEQVLKARVKLEGQKINLANRRRQLEKIQLRGLNFRPFNLGNFINRGNDLADSILGLKKRNRR